MLVLIIAREAPRRLRDLLDDLPPRILEDQNLGFLWIDGSPGVRGRDSKTARAEQPVIPCAGAFTVLRPEVPLGPGAVRKLGFRFAIEEGHDALIVVHHDCPERGAVLAALLDTWERTRADVVLEGPAQDIAGARRAGQGLVASAAEALLRRAWRVAVPAAVHEHHPGMRAYSTVLLARLPFEVAGDDATFDTRILLQSIQRGATVTLAQANTIPDASGPARERPIAELNEPGASGVASLTGAVASEECSPCRARVDAWGTLRAVAGFCLHRIGIQSAPEYRTALSDRYIDKGEVTGASHAVALEIVRRLAPATLLDIGCGPGHIARRVETMGTIVTGIDRDAPPRSRMTTFLACDLEREPLPVDPFEHDAVLLLDVIEHLADPEGFLLAMRDASRVPPGRVSASTIILSTPNVAFLSVRLLLMLGWFTYGDRGILDITHKRLFTRASLLAVLEECGYSVREIVPIGVPFASVTRGILGRMLGRISDTLAHLWPTVFAFQFLVVCTASPAVRQILDHCFRWTPASPASRARAA